LTIARWLYRITHTCNLPLRTAQQIPARRPRSKRV